MGVADYVALAQGCAITAAFCFLVWNAPAMFGRWIGWKKDEQLAHQAEEEKVRLHEAAERDKDRQARHATANAFQSALNTTWEQQRKEISELVAAMTDLRLAVEGLVRTPAVRPPKG